MTMHPAMFDPSDAVGTAIVIAGAVATALSFVLAVRYTAWPREDDPNHPKHVILSEDR